MTNRKMRHVNKTREVISRALGLRCKKSRVRFPVSTLQFQRVVIIFFQVAILVKYRWSDVHPQNNQPTNQAKQIWKFPCNSTLQVFYIRYCVLIDKSMGSLCECETWIWRNAGYNKHIMVVDGDLYQFCYLSAKWRNTAYFILFRAVDTKKYDDNIKKKQQLQ